MQTWQVAGLVLGALLVGVSIPVLLQLRATLRAAQHTLDVALPRVEETLAALTELVVEASEMIEGLQSTTRVVGAIGAAIGPAIVAGVSSYRSARIQSQEENEHEQRSDHENGA